MAATKNQKLKLLYILKFLQENTDENHIAHAEDIKLYLLNHGIAAERKSIYSDISILIDFGYDIIKSNGSGGGYFLASRDFELAELKLLSDAVQAANFISTKKTKQLLNKIFTLTSAEQAKKIKSQVYVDNRPKCKNEELYYTIDKLDRAISDNRKVKIIYRRRILSDNPDQAYEEKEHIISPYSLIWSSDHYYLVGNKEKYDNLMIMRIDRIKHTEIIDDSFPDRFRKCLLTNSALIPPIMQASTSVCFPANLSPFLYCAVMKLSKMCLTDSERMLIYTKTVRQNLF